MEYTVAIIYCGRIIVNDRTSLIICAEYIPQNKKAAYKIAGTDLFHFSTHVWM